MSGKRILIVEDSQTQAIRIQGLLVSNGYEVLLSSNGREALELLANERVDLIISDIVMPEMDGFELCETLKSSSKYKDIPVILLTSLNEISDVLRGLSMGADNYISKPYDEQYLLYRVNKMLYKDEVIEKAPENGDLTVRLGKETFKVSADPEKILNFFVSSYEASELMNKNLQDTRDELEKLNESLEQRVEERTNSLRKAVESHKKTLIDLEKALEKSQKLERLKTEFMKNLSHEVRTPMNSVIGFIDLILSEETPMQEKMQFLPYVSKGTTSLLHIIHDMLEAAETVSENIVLKKTECNIEELFTSLINEHQQSLYTDKKEEVRIKYYIPEKLKEKKIKTYSEKLKVVLDKLLSNALKFCDEGMVEMGVELHTDHVLKFYVKDDGIGINSKYFEEIFDSFKQLEEEHAIKYPGTGVGLTIAKKLVEVMGGDIWLSSEEKVGTEFCFTAPYFGEVIHEKEDRNEVQPQKELSDITMLVAEDFEPNYSLIDAIAQKNHMRLIWAKNGKEAVEKYIKNNSDIDVVLMDVQMPVMTGIEAAERIKRKFPDAKIIALTAYAREITTQQIQQSGFDRLLSKPVRPSKLIEIIRKELILKG